MSELSTIGKKQSGFSGKFVRSLENPQFYLTFAEKNDIIILFDIKSEI